MLRKLAPLIDNDGPGGLGLALWANIDRFFKLLVERIEPIELHRNLTARAHHDRERVFHAYVIAALVRV